jgi:hypothetical protein
MRTFAGVVILSFALAGCSSQSAPKTGTPTPQMQPPQRVAPSSNPVAKYIELAGFRITEKSPGKLQVKFAVINHSDADIGNIAMTVNLRATTSKPSDPPLATFNARVEGLGPEDLKEVTAEVPTKLRVYELPDWQFLTSDFQITEPK